MTLMPEWVQTLANFLPFQWTFGFPITALVGPITDRELAIGLAAQGGWIVFGALLTWLVWRRAVRLYTAVSG
jgi:ABC-2 type transport system permease protein